MKKRVFFRPINTNFVVKELIQIEVLNTKIVFNCKKKKKMEEKSSIKTNFVLP